MKHWWNNGEIETRAEVCPRGFTRGRLPRVFNAKLSEYRKKKNRENRGTRKWYNNGEKEILLRYGSDIPRGFVLGRLYSSTRSFDTYNKRPHGNTNIWRYSPNNRGKNGN